MVDRTALTRSGFRKQQPPPVVELVGIQRIIRPCRPQTCAQSVRSATYTMECLWWLLLLALLGSSRPSAVGSDLCEDFASFFPYLSEGHQLSSVAKEFLGAASLEDIVHHNHAGDLGVFAKSVKRVRYSILFAEHYNSRALYMMLHYIKMLEDLNKNSMVRFDIVVSDTNKTRLGSVANKVKKCSSHKHIIFYNRKVEELPEKYRFDYIEFNLASLDSHRLLLDQGGASLLEKLRYLQSMLLPSGVIGMSLFCFNAHEQRIRSLAGKASGASREKLVDLYLRSQGLQLFADDNALEAYLSAGLALASPHLSEVKEMAAAAGFVVSSVIPRGFSEPFNSFGQYSVLRHWSCGVEQQAFTESAIPSFRYSLYLSREVGHPRSPSRVVDRTGSLRVVDRTGTLSAMFVRSEESPSATRSPVHFSFNHFSAPNIIISYTLSPVMAHATTLLSSRFTMNQILSDCVSYAERHGEASSILLRYQLERFIDTLQHLHLVTMLTG